jgi:predicted glycosyltransferase
MTHLKRKRTREERLGVVTMLAIGDVPRLAANLARALHYTATAAEPEGRNFHLRGAKGALDMLEWQIKAMRADLKHVRPEPVLPRGVRPREEG